MKFKVSQSIFFSSILFFLLLLPVNAWSFDASALKRSDVNAFDRISMFPFSEPLDMTSQIFTYASLLTPAVLVATPKSEWVSIGIMYAESVILTFGIKEAGKLLINRNRPYMYFDDYPQNKIDNGDYKQSMPSGHSALAFTGATFTTFMFNQYLPDSKWTIPVIAGSYTLATTAALLRNTSGNHFITDIITGASIGAFSGFIVPWLHTLNFAKPHKTKNPTETQSKISNVTFTIIPSGFTVRIGF
ncbi:MAG TPA: phosphatase PAP2 family protein [Treponemataceae bacterium]|nr:phosphatase PAP2 family protein [Treponemataceae bacterium]